MVRLSAAILSAILARSIYGQVLAGSDGSASAATATQVATAVIATAVTTSISSAEAGTGISSTLGTGETTATNSGAAQVTASTTTIYFPGADVLPYVASVIGESGEVQTLAISCGPGVDADKCGFPSSVTVTAGPSTVYVSVSNQEATFIYDCQITGSTAAVCKETFNGNDAYIATGSAGPTGSTSALITETLASSDITWIPITVTAGGTAPTQASQSVASPTSAGSNSGVIASPSAAPSSPQSASGKPIVGNDWTTLEGMSGLPSASAVPQPAAGSAGGSPPAPPAVGTPLINPSPQAGGTAPAGTSPGIVASTTATPVAATWTGLAARPTILSHLAAGALMLAGFAL